MKKTKEIVLYDDTENYKRFDKQEIFSLKSTQTKMVGLAKKTFPMKQSTKRLTSKTQKRGEI